MNSYVIVVDSTCDLEPEILASRELIYAPMNYTIGMDEYEASADWKCHDPKEYYDMLRQGVRIQTTQVPASTFETIFSEQLKAGKDILYIACSSGLSGSVHTGKIIADELLEDYPERTIICYDSLISSLGQGHLALEAANKRDAGCNLADTVAYLDSIKFTINQFGTVDSLEYLKRAGRVTATSAFFGNLMGIKPILISDRAGHNLAVKKIKGAAAVRKEMAKMIAEVVIEPQNQTLYISHADALDSARELQKEVEALVRFQDVHINYIAPIVGASVGPGTIIAFCVGREVTEEGES